MQISQPRFIKVNPKFSVKVPALQMLFCAEVPEDIPAHEVEAICVQCQKWLRFQTKMIVENNNLCVGCFAQLLPQCPTYQVIGHSQYQIIGGGWPARDQLLLLEAIQRFGFGNWTQIQQYMNYFGANYLTDQIQLHYDKYYGKRLEQIQDNVKQVQKTKVYNASKKNFKRVQHGGKFIQRSTWMSYCQLNCQQKQTIPCYNSKRGQFNIEYKQNLEKYVADLEFRDDDSQKEIQLKYQILQAYNLGLQDRIKKHNFILEHRLLDENYQAEQSRFLEQNIYAKKAHQLIIQLMKTMTREEYLQMRKSVQFCFKVQAIIDNLRFIRNSGNYTSLRSICKLQKLVYENQKQMGKPRKKVHKNPQDTQQMKEKAILKKLNIGKEQLKILISKSSQNNEAVIYKDIKITPINNLNSYEQE